MPNWCMNTLTVSGSVDELRNFVMATQGLPAKYPPQEWEKLQKITRIEPTEPRFCFNALVPTPDSVLKMGYDAHDKMPKDALLFAHAGRPFTPIDGYHWNILNWGTKWDVYYDNITPEGMGWSEGCEYIGFDFYTAWSPPLGWLEAVVERFPSLEFELHYEEPGCYFAGDAYGTGGVCNVVEYDQERCNQLFQDPEDEEFITS